MHDAHGTSLRMFERRSNAAGGSGPADRAGRPAAAPGRACADGRPGTRRLGRRSRVGADPRRGARTRSLARPRSEARPGGLGDAHPGDARGRRRGADRGLLRARHRRSRRSWRSRPLRSRSTSSTDRSHGAPGRRRRWARRLDGEVDAFLILALSVEVAPSVGAWVLAIGVARYAFLAAGWLFAWMRAPLPRRDWRKVVTAAQGITLTIAAAEVLPLDADPRRPRRRARPARRVVRTRRLVAVAAPHAAARGVAAPSRPRPLPEPLVLTLLALRRRVGRPGRSEPSRGCSRPAHS